MDLSKIKKGMIIKNYKELCSLLDVSPTTGTAKIAQLKEWARYFSYEKQGHKFIIVEIYEIPLPKDFSDNDIYSKYIQVILTKYLKEKGCGYFTTTQLLRLCGFVNENWDDLTLLPEYAERNNITYAKAKYYYNQLYQHVYSYCTKALTRCLNRLSDRNFLVWEKVLFIEKNNVKHEATIDEHTEYMNIVFGTKNEMDIKRTNIYNRDEYYKRLNNKFKELGWNNAFYLIKIVYASNYIDSVIEESERKYYQSIKSVNDHCLEQMYKYIDVDIENDIKKLANKMNEDIEIARLCIDVEAVKESKIDITDMYIDINNGKNFDN